MFRHEFANTLSRVIGVVTAFLMVSTWPHALANAESEMGVTVADYVNAAGSRRYLVYTPSGDTEGRPMIVWLHGCDPAANDPTKLLESPLARVARERGFVLVSPTQPTSAHPGACWNWGRESDQHRGSGEPSIIAGITEEVRDRLGIDPDRVYAIGHSAGGLMTTIMGAAYPDIYAAISSWCTGAYAGGTDTTGLAAHAEMGSHARPLPVLVVESNTDPLSTVPLGRMAVRQWVGTNSATLAMANHPQPRVQRQEADPGRGFEHGATVETYDFGPAQVRMLALDDGGHLLDGDSDGVTEYAVDFVLGYRLR
ncbi:extracellular catalytic domain type 1 short-chain-length polyhydroxyalkanoate depolymerase [Nocardia noduli]|uniref:extracellular catalytic domain type 1 short-chain-length polyhydroxyalkanoate depolymerase n=1 Tax=Nocardia noduli TaxID=2815722 RepID=UPI0020B385E5|nr:PHB depolymerase family esterase [Nocardia noduli]